MRMRSNTEVQISGRCEQAMVLLNALYLIIDLLTQEEEMSERSRLSAGRII